VFSEVRVAEINKTTIKIAIAFVAIAALGLAQDAPKGPVAKDEQEANLINTANKEPDPAKRLTELDEWKQKYPDTQLQQQRDLMYWVTYQQLKPPKGREAIDWAKSVLSKKPDDYMALMTVVMFGPAMNGNNPSQDDFDATIAAANKMVEEPDQVFATANKPPTVPDAQWPQVRPYWVQQAPRIEAQMWVNKKDPAKAETEIGKILQKAPNDGAIDQMMGGVILAEKIPEKQGVALFYYARAACYDGDGSLPAQTRTQLKNGFLTRAYSTFHGSAEGLDQLCATAKANPAPPSDFKVKSTVDIATDIANAAAAAAKANPAGTIWKSVKDGLSGDGSDAFFAGSVKDAALPGKDPSDSSKDLKWKGKIVSMKPAIGPKTIVMAVDNPEGDVTLTFEEPLHGKMDVGTELEFSGTATAFVKSPYMLTLSTDKDQIVGWKPAPMQKKSTPKKKAQ
jgi:hypothetical protein